jgi:hypothetical protein
MVRGRGRKLYISNRGCIDMKTKSNLTKDGIKKKGFDVKYTKKLVVPDKVIRNCKCKDCVIQAKKDNDNDTLTTMETEIIYLDGKVKDKETHAVQYPAEDSIYE